LEHTLVHYASFLNMDTCLPSQKI